MDLSKVIQFGISVPIWLSEKFVLAPAFDIKTAESIGKEIGLAVAPRFYIKKEKLSPYIGLRFGVIISDPNTLSEDNDKIVDKLGGFAFGGEYFLSYNFSFGVEAQGNFTKSDKGSDRFGNPNGLNFNTGTVISATIYF